MKNGGYQIINLKDNDLTSSFTLSGVYELIESNYRKAILLSGIVIDGVEKNDAFVEVEVDSDSNYIIKVYDRTITITSDDLISSTEGGNHLYLLSFNTSDTYISILTPVKTGLNNVVINTDSTDYTTITLTDTQKEILLSALENSANYFITISTDVHIIKSLKDVNTIDFEDEGGTYNFTLSWYNDVLNIVENANNDEITIYEEQLF